MNGKNWETNIKDLVYFLKENTSLFQQDSGIIYYLTLRKNNTETAGHIPGIKQHWDIIIHLVSEAKICNKHLIEAREAAESKHAHSLLFTVWISSSSGEGGQFGKIEPTP